MQDWIPISTSAKGRLALAAVREFGAHRFEDVTVGRLAAAANVTTGAIYHHFGSKLGLHAFVRDDVERRVLDRMEGVVATVSGTEGVRRALLVGFDFAVDRGFLRLLGERVGDRDADPLSAFLDRACHPVPAPIGRVLAAAWRAALVAVADGASATAARTALGSLTVAPA